METLPEIVQEGSSSGSLKIKIKIPQVAIIFKNWLHALDKQKGDLHFIFLSSRLDT